MAEFLSQRLLGRLGGVLFALSGVVTLLNLAVPAADRNMKLSVSLGVLAIGIGGACWIAPWHKWPKQAMLTLVPIAFGMISYGGFGGDRPRTYAIYWVVVFVWIGVAQPRRTSLTFAPVAGV